MSTPRPIAVSDQQLSAIMTAAAALAPLDRDPFLRALAEALRAAPGGEVGDGVLARTIKNVIRPFFRPPVSTAGPAPARRVVGEPIE